MSHSSDCQCHEQSKELFEKGKQRISCGVRTCMYNDCIECGTDMTEGICSLAEIHVAPRKDCCSKSAEESLCATYRAKE